jgi:hypothetical protein
MPVGTPLGVVEERQAAGRHVAYGPFRGACVALSPIDSTSAGRTWIRTGGAAIGRESCFVYNAADNSVDLDSRDVGGNHQQCSAGELSARNTGRQSLGGKIGWPVVHIESDHSRQFACAVSPDHGAHREHANVERAACRAV